MAISLGIYHIFRQTQLMWTRQNMSTGDHAPMRGAYVMSSLTILSFWFGQKVGFSATVLRSRDLLMPIFQKNGKRIKIRKSNKRLDNSWTKYLRVCLVPPTLILQNIVWSNTVQAPSSCCKLFSGRWHKSNPTQHHDQSACIEDPHFHFAGVKA